MPAGKEKKYKTSLKDLLCVADEGVVTPLVQKALQPVFLRLGFLQEKSVLLIHIRIGDVWKFFVRVSQYTNVPFLLGESFHLK